MTDADAAATLLLAAEAGLARARYCWLATTDGGAPSARPMGRTPRAPGDDPWTLRFVTDARSRKISDIWAHPNVAVAVQSADDEAFLTLYGQAAVRPRACDDAALWREAYRAYFPGRDDVENAAFLEVRTQRIDMWIRGVTPEPFGGKTTTLTRDVGGAWRLLARQP